MSEYKPVVCRIATTDYAVLMFLRKQIEAAIANGFKVIIICSPSKQVQTYASGVGATYIPVRINRRFSPISDLISLVKLLRVLNREKVDIIHSITTKAGLLAAVSGCLLRIPVRMHIIAGLPWMEMEGWKRVIGRWSDWLTIKLNSKSYPDSPSQKSYLISNKIGTCEKLKVLGKGTVSGVDYERFSSVNCDVQKIKADLGITASKIGLFLGRVCKEKGVEELVKAFEKVCVTNSDCALLIVGPEEKEIDPLSREISNAIDENPNIVRVGSVPNPEIYYHLADFLILPSYREGFGLVVLEAAAAGIPTIGTDIVGLRDAIEDGITGELVEVKNVESLKIAIFRFFEDDNLRMRLGKQAEYRVKNDFSEQKMINLLLQEYKNELNVNDC